MIQSIYNAILGGAATGIRALKMATASTEKEPEALPGATSSAPASLDLSGEEMAYTETGDVDWSRVTASPALQRYVATIQQQRDQAEAMDIRRATIKDLNKRKKQIRREQRRGS